ncbi:MAG: hypothetical protein JW751_23410 [Polyangiaceae bacterium]|nr:hypothetical protein [Polyangiaceae bacterium]
MSQSRSRFVIAAAAVLCASSTLGCGEKVEYVPRPAHSGAKASLPAVANLPTKPVKKGDMYTVWGASLYLRSMVHNAEINHTKVTIEGYINKTNLMDAPECAVHKYGKADPEGCRPPVPTFWLCDEKSDKPEDCIMVMGWVSNYAQIWKAIEQYDKTKDEENPEPVTDDYWGKEIPRPLPAPGGKAKVTGSYTTTFTGASQGTAADPIMGILTYEKIEWIEPPPEPATLPNLEKLMKGAR